MSPRQIIVRGFFLGVLVAILGAGAFFAYVEWYTGTDRILPGVRVGQIAVGGLGMRVARSQLQSNGVIRPPLSTSGVTGGNPMGGTGGVGPQLVAEHTPSTAATASLNWEDRTWTVPMSDVGGGPNVAAAVREAVAIGRKGSLWDRAFAFLGGVVHGYYVPLQPGIREKVLTERLKEIAKEIDRPAVDSAYDPVTDSYSAEAEGRALDIPATLEALQQVVRMGRPTVKLVVKPVPPRVTRAQAVEARKFQIARFTTPILNAEAGRVHNISLAAEKIRSVVLMPGDIFSFNEIVGPRDEEHGWQKATELYQGEFVMGFGGGICQVSSTLYNAVLLAGLEVKERYHHTRPLQYIDPGRDATVVYGQLDFRFRNSSDGPIWIGARILPGQPQQIEVTLYGSQPVEEGSIRIEEQDVKYIPPMLEEVPDPSLAPEERKVVDEGHEGIVVTIVRVFKEGDGERREQVSQDKYEPKAGKVRVGRAEAAPGAE